MKHKGLLYFVTCVAIVAFGVIHAQILQRSVPAEVIAVAEYSDLPVVTDDRQATQWIYKNIKYDTARLIAKTDDVQPYQVTLSRRAGICKDTAALLLTIVERELHEDGEFVVLKLWGVQDGTLHAVVRVNGDYLDPTTGRISSDPPGAIVAVFPLDKVWCWK